MANLFRCVLWACCLAVCLVPSAHAVGFNVEHCRARVERLICVKQNNDDEKCQADRAGAGQEILSIFDIYPPLLQRMMCALEKIQVVENFYASGDVTHDNTVTLRADLVTSHLPLSTWISWKEQLPFNEHFSRYAVDPNKPFVTAIYRAGVNGTLMYLLTHELAHTLDRANDATSEKNEAFLGKRWTNPQPTNRLKPYYTGEELCFYSVCTPAVPTNWTKFYRTIGEEGFISLYAMSTPGEDFAELTTFLLMKELVGLRYFLHTPDGTTIDVIRQLDHPALRNQVAYVRRLLTGPDVRIDIRPSALILEAVEDPGNPNVWTP